MASTIPSFSRERPGSTYVDEVDPYNQRDLYHMNSSVSFPSSSDVSRIKYDVFISFRGLDTRRGFLSHLLSALSRKNIEAYVDYKLKEGDELLPALFTAIEESQIALIIFSEDYASSKWCLEELVKINECRMKNGQIVIPIFYNVNPSDVRRQEGCYKSTFAEHEKLFKDNIMIVEKWRTTLKEVANLCGFHSMNFGSEAELIEVVIQRLLTRLNNMYQVDLKGLVGIDKPIADLQSLISCNKSEHVGVIGIWGMGGIGKTTIARALFNKLCSEYESCCFLENVREQSEKHGIVQVKRKLISILLEENDPNISVPYGVPAHVLRRLRRKKILIILDDVNNPNQVRDLVGGHNLLGPGSIIIVTTRDKHVIKKEADNIYEVKALGSHDALNLLNLHAFNGNCLQMNWHKLMLKVVEYAEGIPLALEVLGSLLYGKSAEEWESQLQKLQKMPCVEIQNVLRLSYEGLDREERSIFLYIACFFEQRETKANVEVLLNACGYSMPIAFRTLEDKALILRNREYVYMHDLIREMGREIVREQSIGNPGERNHLWDPNDVYRVLKYDEGTEHIESITLDMSRISDLILSPHSFAGMVNLNLLRLYAYSNAHSRVHLPEGLTMLPDKIKFFHWDGYPSKSLPTTFNAENLVELRMRRSHITKLWDGVPNLTNLKLIDLHGSEQLMELPDLSKATSLERLSLSRCANLLYVHPSIFSLQSLAWVSLQYCRKLEKLPVVEALPSSDSICSKLGFLDLFGCESLNNLPDSWSKMRSLTFLGLEGSKQLDTSSLQIIFDGSPSLESLYLDRCCSLFELPENISKLLSLRSLSLMKTNVKSLPENIKQLPRLQYLSLTNCRRLQSIPEIPAPLSFLNADGCTSLKRLFTPTPQLQEQHIRYASEDGSFLSTEFSFDGCPNLDKDALDAILAYVESCNERKKAIFSEKQDSKEMFEY